VNQSGFPSSTLIEGHIMKLPHRRQFLRQAAGAAAIPAFSRIAWAQAYPTRPVRIIVGFASGGTPDIVARLMGQWLSQRLGQQFVIENRPGAGSNIATEAVVNAPADGHMLLLISGANAWNTSLYEKLNFNFVRDIVPVASIQRTPFVMDVNPSFPAKTVPEFIAYAKENPGKLNLASGGNGSAQHVSGELFKMMAGVDMVHVPYRGPSFELTALIVGEAHVAFDPLPTSIAHIRAGTLRPLAVTTAARWEELPDIPTVGEFVPRYEASGWVGIGAPKNTPIEIITKLNEEINAGLNDPKLKLQLANLGGTVFAGSPAEFGKHIAAETEKWGKVIKFAGIKAE
jgi:tripartite-type tricarboxylate transporter receptor subunit TctC